MLENPLVPPNLLQSHSRTQNDDMTLDTDLALPVKKRRGDLPLKKRYQSSVAAEKCVQNLLNFNDKAENEEKTLNVDEKSPPSSDSPMDFSLPNRIRAIFKQETNAQLVAEYRSLENLIEQKPKASDIAQNSIFAVNPLFLHFNSSLASSALALQNGLMPSGLSSVNVPFTVNFPFNFPSTPFISRPLPDVSTKPNGYSGDSFNRGFKKTKSKQCNGQNLPMISRPRTNSDVETSTSVESYVINPATGNRVRRCYKNMTTERRMEANARERTRVHTIGAAFDRLRKMIPSLAHDQKLSKLSILRISCSYIMLLAAMNDLDYSADSQGYTIEECTEMLTETIISEAKFKR